MGIEEGYLGISAGYNFLSDYDFQSSGATAARKEISFDNSPSVSFRLGMPFQDGWRGELGLGYQNYDIDDISSTTGESGDVNLYEITLNFLYDFEKISGSNYDLTPFLGIGAGAVYVDADASFTHNSSTTVETVSASDWAPAVKVQAGLQYDISEQTDLVFNYSALIFPDDSVQIDNTMVQHSINVGFNFSY